MAWSVPNTITGTTLVNQTDDLIQGNFDDLENYVNSTAPYSGVGLAEDQTNIVNVTAAQTVTGAKTFSAAIIASSGVSGNVTGNLTGNAATATTAATLTTGRTISLAGDTTGSATFDGSANISITASVSALATKAATAGSPTQSFSATTAASGTNTTQVATTAFVQTSVATEANVQSDWNASSGDAQILNKPTASLVWGAEQTTGYLNGFDAVINYSVPANSVMTGLYSYHDNGAEDRRWKVKYRSLTITFG